LRGRFAIQCAAGADGRTVLQREEVSAPFHLSKPYWTDEVLMVQAVNATAGVFAGDRLRLDIDVQTGARVLLTSPSAARIHTMPEGRAEQRQHFRVAGGGWLEIWPELFIPQAGCRYRQETQVDVEPGGALFFVETLAPGRVARGEVFAFAEVSWLLELRRSGRLLMRECYTLRSDQEATTWPLRRLFPASYYASCAIVSDPVDLAPLRPALDAGVGPTAHLALTRLDACAWSLKVIAADSTSLRLALQGARSVLAEKFPQLRADTRKL
jgi:urease accessory protein